MTPFAAILLGIVEGITEFLPISSTGHLILTSFLLGIADTDFLKTFEIVVQMGAICAVLVLYWRSFLQPSIVTKLLCGFIPTAIIGFTLYPLVKDYLLGNVVVVILALAFGGIVLIIFELSHKEKADTVESIAAISTKQAVIIGLFQSFALVPGVSRSAATIIGGLLAGISRVTIVEFSFLLAVPTMTAATTYDIYKSHALFNSETLSLLALGFTTSFLVALFVIKKLLVFIKNHTFIYFGVYRILLAIIFTILFLF